MKFLRSPLIALAVVLSAFSTFASELRHPNILLLMAEDIGCDLSCYGANGAKTPNIDRLAAEGIRYDRFYTTSPICSPSRTALMTGMYQTTLGGHHHRSKVQIPDYVLPVTQYFREAGYVNILGSDLVFSKGKKTDLNFRVDPALLFDKKAARKVPFFQQVQLKATHRDAKTPRWKRTRKNSLHPVGLNSFELPPYLPDTPEVRLDWAMYLDTMEYIDHEIGLLMDQLESEGILENTIIIFMGDNGRCQVRGKSYLWEDGIHCPLIIWGKGIEQGVASSDLLSGIDLTATILMLAGVEPPQHMQGRAFLADETYHPRGYVFAARDRHDEIMDCSRAIVGKRYKYIRNFMPEVPWDSHMNYYENPLVRPLLPYLRKMNAAGQLSPEQAYFFRPEKPEEQLYDLQSDPWELKNLASAPEYKEIKKRLHLELDHWIETSGDRGLKKDDIGRWVPSSISE